MVDEFSRSSVATVIKDKEADSVVDAILSNWIRKGLGYPTEAFRADNGNEFKKETVEEIARKIGVKVLYNANYAPWMNGVVERKHATIDVTVRKILDENKDMKLEAALEHAVWCHNQEIGRNGFSAEQIQTFLVVRGSRFYRYDIFFK